MTDRDTERGNNDEFSVRHIGPAEKQQKEMKEKERKERNRAALAKEQRRIFWCNAYEQGNYVSIHSDKFKSRGKKYEYY